MDHEYHQREGETVEEFHDRLMRIFGCEDCEEFGNNGCGAAFIDGYWIQDDCIMDDNYNSPDCNRKEKKLPFDSTTASVSIGTKNGIPFVIDIAKAMLDENKVEEELKESSFKPDLREYVSSSPQSTSMLSSKTYKVIEDGLVDDAISSSKTAKEYVSTLVKDASEAVCRVKQVKKDIRAIEKALDPIDIESLRKQELTGDARRGVALYSSVLDITKRAFGEEHMTDEVICKAIEAASYGMWRTIMGPKYKENY